MVLLDSNDPILREKSSAVERFDDNLRELVKSLITVLDKHDVGMAIAAPQVGLLQRIIVIKINNKQTNLVMINPVIMQKQNSVVMNEGCLSFPNQYRNIKRPSLVKVKWKDLNGRMQFGEFSGIEARAILHEVDHLNGKLFTDISEVE